MNIIQIRADPELYKDNQRKRFKNPDTIDDILSIDTIWKSYTQKGEKLKMIKNKLDKCFKSAPINTNKGSEMTLDSLLIDEDIYTVDNLIDDILNDKKDINLLTHNQLKMVVTHIKKAIKDTDIIQDGLLHKRDGLIMELGNILNPFVPISNDELFNSTVSQVDNSVKLGYCLQLYKQPKVKLNHIDLLDKLGFTNSSDGIKVAGNRGYFLTGFGVKLNMALINYATDFLEKRNYTLMETPHFVNGELMGKITQLSDYNETLYKLENEDKYLIATSEQPMTGYFANKTLNLSELPVKFAGISSCYRKEVGAHGKNTRGIYRVHQFTKVEQFCVTSPETSWNCFNEMINISKEFYDSLNISYRIINIVSGVLNNAASMKYDLEALFPGSSDYCELVSCTNCLDYFSRRIKTKYNKTEFPHMLNCTLCANTRTLCCLVETYQVNNGIVIPEVLRPYLDNIDSVKFVK
ncbi:MAG: seryl-tRNA synthetase [Homavirus sp.]|uniref:serine--tRNA ligase n=1 Tax=Homavirus sp. TaxID=2487769 RepID=A0A3G5A497_9VIRU|nr:MAG: seryl-tRNA synthetase [Homavirus sp.]